MVLIPLSAVEGIWDAQEWGKGFEKSWTQKTLKKSNLIEFNLMITH